MKNLTFEQNIQQIGQNHQDSSSFDYTGAGDFLDGEELGSLFSSVRDQVMNSQDGLGIGLRVYGLSMPVGFAVSDFCDHRIRITVEEKPFNTIEGIRDYLVGELLSNNEVYVYTICSYVVYNPSSFTTTKRYQIRCKSVNRSLWGEMTEQAESNNNLTGHQLWGRQPTFIEPSPHQPDVTPKYEIKKHKF